MSDQLPRQISGTPCLKATLEISLLRWLLPLNWNHRQYGDRECYLQPTCSFFNSAIAMEYESPTDLSYRYRSCSRFNVGLLFTLNAKRQDSWPGGYSCADGLGLLQETIWFHSTPLGEDWGNDVSFQGASGEFEILMSFAIANDIPL